MDLESAIYDSELLQQIISNIDQFQTLPKSLQFRPLQFDDFSRGYCELLSNLTRVGEVSSEQFASQFNAMKSCKNHYFITVIEDLTTNRVIGSTSAVKELKFIHETGSRWRIEDVVVDQSYRGKGLAKLLVQVGVEMAKSQGAYKLSLECSEDLIPFYAKQGLSTNKNHYMEIRF